MCHKTVKIVLLSSSSYTRDVNQKLGLHLDHGQPFHNPVREGCRQSTCAVRWSSAGVSPARELIPPGSSRSRGGGDDDAEGFDGEGRNGDLASVHAVTYVNAEQPETGNAGVQGDFTKSVLFCTVVLVGKSVKANT